ncbi:MAG TPA: phosphoribosyltransferase family protein [Candidatus Aquicultor sp.]|jgi:predicted phosphoribosyltransferase
MFKDRVDAGRKLALRLEGEYKEADAVVLAIPRGGVVVGNEVVRILGVDLDIITPRKIGAPGNPELAIGAAAQGEVIINESLVRQLGISREYVEQEAAKQMAEIERRRRLYLGDSKEPPLTNRIAIIVDDGLATGYTALAAIHAVKRQNPSKTVLAVPVAPTDTYMRLKPEVDELVCLEFHDIFYAVGQFYESFEQTTDAEVIEILRAYRREGHSEK